MCIKKNNRIVYFLIIVFTFVKIRYYGRKKET